MTEQMNVPKLRFGEFDDEWKIASLGQLLTVGNGKDYKHLGKGDIPVFGTGGYMLSVDKSLHDGESVFIGRKGSIDKPFYYNGAFWTVDTLFYTKDFKGITPKFTYNLFQRINWKLYNEATGVPSLSKTTIQKIKVDVPSLLEQQKIASFLSKVDEKIALLTEKKAKLTEYKKGVMQQLFDGKWQEQDGKLVFVPPTLRFKADDGSEFPDWEEKALGDFSRIYDGTHQTPKYVDKGVPFYSVEHVTANQFEKTKYISEEVYAKECKRVTLEKGDILLTRIGSVGDVRLIDWDVRASFYVSLALVKYTNEIVGQYLASFMQSPYFQSELWKRMIHVAFPKKINLGEIGHCLVSVPSKDEQTKVANFLSAIDQKIDLTNSELDKAKEWKKGLLQQMFV